jgi:cell division septation protein DedD
MSAKYLVAALLLLASPSVLSAQSVKAGIEAWQRADYTAAVAIWRPLAEKGDADAAFNLGQAYRLGRGVPTNLSAAKTWLERAADKNHVDAQTTLGLLLFQNGDQAEGLRWLKSAAEKGEPRALLVYGTALVNGDGVTQDPARGYAFVSRAAAQGLAPARETLKQLDQLLSLEDRKKGVAMARAKAKAAPAPRSKPEPPLKPVQTASAKPKPTPKPVTPIATPPTTSGAWRIQLGAFSQRGSAEALYQRVSGNGALTGRQAFYIAAGAVTRLQVGPFASRAEATAACRAVGQACFAVPAK